MQIYKFITSDNTGLDMSVVASMRWVLISTGLFLGLVFAQPSFAKKRSNKAHHSKKAGQRSKARNNDNTRNSKKARSFTFDAGISGGFDLAPAAGVSANYRASPGYWLGLTYSIASITTSTSEPDEVNPELTNNIGISLGISTLAFKNRWFLSESFYLLGGLAYRSIGIAMESTTTTSTSDATPAPLQMTFDVQQFAVEFAIGNQWQFNNGFYLGCTWLGAFIPLQTTSSASFKLGDGEDELESFRTSGSAIVNKTLSGTNVQALIGNIGFAF